MLTLKSLIWNEYRPRRINMKDSSAKQLEYSVSSLERFHAREIGADEFTEQLVLPWLMDRIATCSRSTAKRDLSNLMTLWRFAHKKGFCPAPASKDIDPVRVDPTIPRAWTIDELRLILDACRDLKGEMRHLPIKRSHWWSSLVEMLYDTGARITAALSVRSEDFLPETGFVLLRTVAAKTRVEQLVPLSDQTIISIGRHFTGDRQYIWPWPWRPQRVWEELKKIHLAAGVPADRYVGFHRIRKTTATQTVIAVGWEAARVALGHTSENMTRRYVDLRQVPRPRVELPRL